MTVLMDLFDRLFAAVRNERGVVSVEWIILGIVIMVAIVAAFQPTFQAALTAGVGAVQAALTGQAAQAGS